MDAHISKWNNSKFNNEHWAIHFDEYHKWKYTFLVVIFNDCLTERWNKWYNRSRDSLYFETVEKLEESWNIQY